MSLSIGIVGLPNVGKSTLFNALLKRQAALAANYPFATIEPNMGVVDVPDARLHTLEKIVQAEYKDENLPEKTIPSVVKFFDIAGLVEGAHKGEGLGNQFLSHIREVDAIAHVVRDFTDENVVRAGSTEPTKDLELINTELLLADLQTIDKRLESRKFKDDHPFLNRVRAALEEGQLINELELSDDEAKYVKELGLLTQKPALYIKNVDEAEIRDVQGEFINISAKTEEELVTFSDEEKKEYLKDLGVEESGLDTVIKRSYSLLGLQDFFTAGPKEVRAWTIKIGTKAPQAAGTIHTDFERGFIKAEVVTLAELEKAGGWKAAKELGKIRQEGKDYVMQEGDVVEFRFNV